MPKISERIKEVRTALGLSQNEFGEKMGLTRGAIVNAELGRAQIKPLFISHICDVFNVNETWLRTGEGEMFLPMDEDEEFLQICTEIQVSDDDFIRRTLKAYWELDDEKKAVIRQLISAMAGNVDNEKSGP